MRQRNKSHVGLVLVLVCALLTATLQSPAFARHDDYDYHHNDSYVFATTRGLNELDMHPAFKIPAWPLAFVLDIVFLPFAALADAMNQ